MKTDSPALRAAVILLLTVLVYLPAMSAGFIWDDDILLNPIVKSAGGLRDIWFSTRLPDYFPLTSTSLWIEWRLWGDHATGYHVTNVLLHALSALFLWRAMELLKIPGAWLAALVFAVHPVNVESVAWIAERKNALAMTFYSLALWFYQKSETARKTRRGGAKWYWLSLFVFLLALLSKTAVVVLPVALVFCAWWRRRRLGSGDVMRVLPFFAFAIVLGLVTVWFQRHSAFKSEVVDTGNFVDRLATAGCAVWFYLGKALLPVNLSFVYTRWNVHAHSPLVFLPVAAAVAGFALLWFARRNARGRAALFGLGYFVAALFPVLGFFQIYFQKYSLVADHWQYFSIIGVIALVVGGTTAWLEQHLSTERAGRFSTATGILLVGALSVLTWRQAGIYQDKEALWRDTLKKNPACWMASNNLGRILAERHDYAEAIKCFEAALPATTDPWITRNNLANALAATGRKNEAAAQYELALRENPNYAEAHKNFGSLLLKRGDLSGARSHLEAALRSNPAYADAHAQLGMAFAGERNFAAAIGSWREALRLNPGSRDALNGLAWTFATQVDDAFRNGAEARRLAEELVRLYPSPEAYDTLAAACAETGNFEDAVSFLTQALNLELLVNPKLQDDLRAHLEKFQARKPWRE